MFIYILQHRFLDTKHTRRLQHRLSLVEIIELYSTYLRGGYQGTHLFISIHMYIFHMT